MFAYSWKRARLSLKRKHNKIELELKQSQIEFIKALEGNGYIDIYLGDESHLGLTPNVPYAWQRKDNPILLPAAKGKFLNVIGLMTRKNNLFFEVLKTTFKTDKIICFMDKFVVQTNKKTVVYLTIHQFINQINSWQKFRTGKKKMCLSSFCRLIRLI